ncbi:hypothetical protein NDR87_17980 [Nocardia sp. CDC159]|uniref:Uncharacterized protein n=1 Tax=Nocardia pulmonis TaxID=2951408 RepID=A0A9X2E7X9_9NOCA|nr:MULTISPECIES: hypothetical protein [Nocardia]MCM6775772.1 hypothetical protein [Nocardia pulmonis]MCM6788252.1 hypothetical protein [Nocardia sp. CDC159]
MEPANDDEGTELPVPQGFFHDVSPDNRTEFTTLSDRLVRHLFDVGLQLHTLRAVFEQHDSSEREIRAASDAVTGLLDDLDMLIRDAGLAVLVLEREPEPPEPPPPMRRKRRR